MAILVLLNNFLHDFSAAGWLFSTVFLWFLLSRTVSGTEARLLQTGTIKVTLLLMRLSLAGIIIFGIFRALAYKQYEWSAAAGSGQLVLLAVKHVILAVVFGYGALFYARGRKTIKKFRINNGQQG